LREDDWEAACTALRCALTSARACRGPQVPQQRHGWVGSVDAEVIVPSGLQARWQLLKLGPQLAVQGITLGHAPHLVIGGEGVAVMCVSGAAVPHARAHVRQHLHHSLQAASLAQRHVRHAHLCARAVGLKQLPGARRGQLPLN
jgi:hypothetical protein